MSPFVHTERRSVARVPWAVATCLLVVMLSAGCHKAAGREPVMVVLVSAADSQPCLNSLERLANESGDEGAEDSSSAQPDQQDLVYAGGYRRGNTVSLVKALRRAALSPATLLPGCVRQFAFPVTGPMADTADAVQGERSASGHSASTDPITGAEVWHTDWQWGECVVVDDEAHPHVMQAWHRHPLGTDYAEVMR